VDKVLETLHLLGHHATELSRRQPRPPKAGIIVATPYVQTGLDLKTAPDILIDSGKDVVIHKGELVYPLPWTTADVSKQRAGRVARLRPGIVYRPVRSGTGGVGVSYPNFDLLMDGAVADFYELPQLTVTAKAIHQQMPYLGWKGEALTDVERLSLAVFYSLWFANSDYGKTVILYEAYIRVGNVPDEAHSLKRIRAACTSRNLLPVANLVSLATSRDIFICTRTGDVTVQFPRLRSGRIVDELCMADKYSAVDEGRDQLSLPETLSKLTSVARRLLKKGKEISGERAIHRAL
jgi:hypothetical protein